MNLIDAIKAKKLLVILFFFTFPMLGLAQDPVANAPAKDFWNHVQIGGGIGLSTGSGYTDILLAPGAIYNFNKYVAAGVGLQGSYVRVKNAYESYIYGGSLIGLFSPIDPLQLSLELEQLRVNTRYSNNVFYNPNYDDRDFAGSLNDNFWNTALYVGAGYRVQHVTLGIRVNLLFDKNKSVYSEAFMPFVRAYF